MEVAPLFQSATLPVFQPFILPYFQSPSLTSLRFLFYLIQNVSEFVFAEKEVIIPFTLSLLRLKRLNLTQ